MARDRSYPKPQAKKYPITQSEIDSIRQDAKHAQDLLDNPFLKTYCQNTKQSIIDMHVKQTLYDAEESTEINGVKKTIKIPAIKEYSILAGKYRFIEQLFADLTQTVQNAKILNEKIDNEELEVTSENG